MSVYEPYLKKIMGNCTMTSHYLYIDKPKKKNSLSINNCDTEWKEVKIKTNPGKLYNIYESSLVLFHPLQEENHGKASDKVQYMRI